MLQWAVSYLKVWIFVWDEAPVYHHILHHGERISSVADTSVEKLACWSYTRELWTQKCLQTSFEVAWLPPKWSSDGELNLLHSLSSWQLLTSHRTGYWWMPGLLSMLIFSRPHSNRYTLKQTWRSMTNFSRHYPHLPTTKMLLRVSLIDSVL